MSNRPKLTKELSSESFKSFYYLKEELVNFCRNENLPTSGGKLEITERIVHYLDTGNVISVKSKTKTATYTGLITENTEIECDFVCSEHHRAFFKEKIGKSFSFNVAFQKWLKANSGKTYAASIKAYYEILEQKKNSKTTIDKQFEYNTYIRDFFADNSSLNLQEAIKC